MTNPDEGLSEQYRVLCGESPLPEARLDEWTESAIREVLNAGLKHGPKDKLNPPTDCPLCSAPISALRSRIRTLIEEARKGHQPRQRDRVSGHTHPREDQ